MSFHTWYHTADPQKRVSVFLAFNGKRIGHAFDLRRPSHASDIPPLTFGPLEITTKFDSEDMVGSLQRLSMEMCRQRVTRIRFYDLKPYRCSCCNMDLFYESKGERTVLYHPKNPGMPCSDRFYEIPTFTLEEVRP